MAHASAANAVEVTPVCAGEFAALMAPHGPFPSLVAVGCSGGPDSLALTRLSEDWARARGGRILALIVEHGLRTHSAAEASVLAEGLAREGIAARILPLGLLPGPRLQERARSARRRALLAACAEAGALHLLLGHHAEDQAETLAFRALRGSGARGLAGMAPLIPAAEALILRPLLALPRARLAATLWGWSIAPSHDPSNDDPRFARARLRASGEVLALGRAAPGFARRRSRLAKAEAQRMSQAVRLLPEGCAAIAPELLGQDAVARRVMAALIRAIGGGGHMPPDASVRALLARGSGTLGGTQWLRGGRWLVREAAKGSWEDGVWDGRFRCPPPPAGLALGAADQDSAQFRAANRHLPAAALAALPALRHADTGKLALIPHLSYHGHQVATFLPLQFAPLAGPVTEWYPPG